MSETVLNRSIPIACHAGQWPAQETRYAPRWEQWAHVHGCGPEPFRRCTFCGSMHPFDLHAYLEQGRADVQGADWKYGWPHKFYVDVPNPYEGRPCVVGSVQVGRDKPLEEWRRGYPGYVNWREVGTGYRADLPGKAGAFLGAKFYNVHLLDLTDEELRAVGDLLLAYTGIHFYRGGGSGRVRWRGLSGHQALGRRHRKWRELVAQGRGVEEALREVSAWMKAQMTPPVAL